MRPGTLAAVSLAAAVLGGGFALGIGKGAGWIGNGTKTVVVKAQTSAPAALPASARAKVVGWDLYDDVGLIQVARSAHALDPVPLGESASVAVGQPVAAIGSPLGNEDSLAVGVVSAIHRSIAAITAQKYNIVDAIQTD